MIDYKYAGQQLRAQRKHLGLTQEAIAEKIGITASFYSQIESGSRKAGIKTFVALSQALSISLDNIIGNVVTSPCIENFDDTEYQIFHRIKNFTSKEKEFVLDIVTSLENLIKT